MAKPSGSQKVIYAALLGNLLVAITKFAAFGVTGSSAVLSEAVHSLVDTGNELLLLYGLRRSRVRPDRAHPLGHGRELYFWSFVVALLVFALGAGVSFYQGVVHLREPAPLHDPTVNYVVLALAFVFEGSSWWVAVKLLRATKGSVGYLEAMRRSKDPGSFAVVLEDSAALIGLFIAFAGIVASHLFQRPEFDGAASIGIAVVLGMTAIFLARETKGLLIGEPAYPEVEASILRIAANDAAVAHVNGLLTVQVGPDNVVAALSAEFHDRLTAPDIESCVNRVEEAIQSAHPYITALFIKPQTTEAWRRRYVTLADAHD
jgi:cation diffusion facilitator family transporter